MPDKVFLCRVLVYLVAIVWGSMQAWNYRFELFFGDSQQFFDMADYYRRGDFDKAISIYWSPLYPMIAGLLFKLIQPTPYWEFFQFKFVNLAFLVITFLSYDFFFANFYKYYTEAIVAKNQDLAVIDKNTLLFSGYALLLLYALAFGGVHQDVPDMVNAAISFTVLGLLLKQIMQPNKLNACLLGITCGVGYLCKTIMFCMTGVYLGVSFIYKRNLVCILLSVACMLAIATPYAWTISQKLGQPTIGESGKFIYINLVEERDPVKAEGLEHPVQFIHKNPEIRAYGDEVPGTVPFLYDLGYWTKGTKINLRFGDLAKVVACDLLYYAQTFFYLPALVLGYVALKTRSWPLSIKSLWQAGPILLPQLALLAQYSVVNNLLLTHYIDRYFIAIYPLIMLGLLISIRVPAAKAGVLRNACIITTIASLALAFSTRFVFDVTDLFKEKHHIWYNAAMALKNDGINHGDRIAQLGMRLHRNTQFTEPEKLRIAASVSEDKAFWDLNQEERLKVMDILRKLGIRALVYAQVPDLEDPLLTKDLKVLTSITGVKLNFPFRNYHDPVDPVGWKQVPGSPIYYYLLDQDQAQPESKQQ